MPARLNYLSGTKPSILKRRRICLHRGLSFNFKPISVILCCRPVSPDIQVDARFLRLPPGFPTAPHYLNHVSVGPRSSSRTPRGAQPSLKPACIFTAQASSAVDSQYGEGLHPCKDDRPTLRGALCILPEATIF